MRFIIKAKAVPIGTVSTHGGRKMKKVGSGKWVAVPEGSPKWTFDKAEHSIDELRVLYKRRDPGKGFEMPIASKHDLELLLNQTTFCMISAGPNPNIPEDAKMTKAQEKQRHQKLTADMRRLGYVYTPTRGQYGAPEDSVFVMAHDAHKREMVTLGRSYNQDSILFVENGKSQLIKTYSQNPGEIGKVVMAGRGHTYVPEADDFYTEVKTVVGERVKFTMVLRDIVKALKKSLRRQVSLW